MNIETTQLAGREVCLAGAPEADALLVQPVDEHDLEGLEAEVRAIESLAPGRAFRLAAFRVEDWNDDLSPWPAPAAFGDQAFAGHGPETLAWVRGALLPALNGAGYARRYVGGYSLAGLFALYAAWQCGDFHGAAGVSPSVWMAGWPEFTRENPVRAARVYLSLGDREERTRNPVMRPVGDNLRALHDRLAHRPGVETTLEWNPGNHFRDAPLRTARGFAWLLNGEAR